MICSSCLTFLDCGGTNVQLLPETISGTTTIGCASWTTQPSANDCPTSAPSVPYPSPSPDSASGSFSGRSQDGAPSRAGQTIVTGTLGSQTTTETFALTTISLLATLSSTVTSTTFDAHSSLQTLVIGPGGVAWAPIRPSSGAPDLPRPALPLPSRSLPGNSQTVTSAPNTGQPSAAVTSTAVQSTAFGAFDNPNQSETTIIVGGTTLHYSKETIQSLSTLTAPKTITTPL